MPTGSTPPGSWLRGTDRCTVSSRTADAAMQVPPVLLLRWCWGAEPAGMCCCGYVARTSNRLSSSCRNSLFGPPVPSPAPTCPALLLAEHEASRLGLPSVCPHNNPAACHPLHPPGQGPSFPVEPLFHRYGVDLAVSPTEVVGWSACRVGSWVAG